MLAISINRLANTPRQIQKKNTLWATRHYPRKLDSSRYGHNLATDLPLLIRLKGQAQHGAFENFSITVNAFYSSNIIDSTPG
ncbi:hypothetical protein L596_001835 [Steinernema carpocapsae]|uniref:Uncharacterized protein n=1 Tax=Steinernema carpocapsae TaxID=34508 RepID=A0A4U8UMR0_STECR|nr:hypothetical protein L596_001835 [Steinernema carpocapsae]